MRISLKRAVHSALLIVLLQCVFYYWTIRKAKKDIVNFPPHKFLKGLEGEESTCSAKGCPPVRDDVINVHLIPHSHIDVGWTKTVEQYYIGEMVPGVWASGCVQCTFNGTVSELLKDKSRRFIFVEMKYLSRYWDEINDTQRDEIKQLIKERRIEIINGGWVMSDSGVTMYNDIIDQHTLGFDFVTDKFGSCAQSRTGWHVDQFGHSREHTSIFAQMGYDSLVLGRIDERDRAERKQNREMEFVWKSSPKNYKSKSYLFTHIMSDGYYAPSRFNFETDYIDWTRPEDANRAVREFIEILKSRALVVQTNHVMIPMGCDFGYKGKAASIWFKNMDNLIEAVHKHQKDTKDETFNLLYSTPSCYTYHVNRSPVKFKVKEDDFLPYEIEPGAYWTGYFTTRGGLKLHIKRAGQILQSCKQLSIFTDMNELFHKVNIMRDALAVMQHHDAITGTQRLAVFKDYNKLLSKATEECEAVMSMTYDRLWSQHGGNNSNFAYFCHDLNISSCSISESNHQFLISFYNPLSWSVNAIARFPIKSEQVTITDYEMKEIPTQIVPIANKILAIPERKSDALNEAVFQTQLPPMSATAFKVNTKTDAGKKQFEPSKDAYTIGNEYITVEFSQTTGKLMAMHNIKSQINENIEQDFAYYNIKAQWERTSGAYLFVPQNEEVQIIGEKNVKLQIYKGEVVQEAHQIFNNWVSQVVRVYKESKCAEFQWIVGPLDIGLGKEVISRFTTKLNSSDKFFTDSNGREIITRIRRSKGKGTSHVYDSVSGNYYPVTSRIYIQDDKTGVQFSILPDRAQGGSSLVSGSIELLIHRNTLYDDDLGIAESLQDVGVDGKGIIYTGKHYVCLEGIEKSIKLTRHLALQIHLAPVPMFSSLDGDISLTRFDKQHSFLSNPLPDNVNVLTLDRISEGSTHFFLLRLEHIFEENEDPLLSVPVTISLESLFKPFQIVSAEETTLGGNFKPHDIKRLKWNTFQGQTLPGIESPNYKKTMMSPFEIQLLPMEIRTFRVTAYFFI